MAQSKIARLVQRIHDKTSKGELDWEESVKENCYTVAFPNYSVQIRFAPNPITSEDYYLSIFDEQGKMIESINDETLDGSESILEEHYYFKLMRNIYDSARRMALGTDEAIDSILENLGEGDPFG